MPKNYRHNFTLYVLCLNFKYIYMYMFTTIFIPTYLLANANPDH